MIRIYFIFTVFCLTSICQLIGQISFTHEVDKLAGLEVSSGAPMAIADMDGDGLDDIISLDRARDLVISYQNLNGSFKIVDFPTVGPSNWGMTVGDVNNNGSNELFTGGAYDLIRLVSVDKDGNNQISFMDGPDIFVQAVSMFDINNDGYLDAIACHDDGPNGAYINDGSGTLYYATDDLPFEKFATPESNAGNYGNVWSDVNGDGLMDYYISKCRQGVTNVTDQRRINQLWINNGNGTFREEAEEYGLAIGLQSWTAEFQDIDNDGDMDCFVTNHDQPSQLYENIDNTSFVDITMESGITTFGLPIQAVMKDFDNDGYVDAFISGNGGKLFHNNGNKTFSEVDASVSNFTGFENSFACGDLNHDGFLDIMIGYGTGFNGPSNRRDKLWLNNGNNNHWLAVQLEGIQSNSGGVGSRIEIYGAFGMMVREVRAGESYGICHTLTQHFGIGQSSAIDSILVYWPSGIKDSYQNIPVDQFVTLKEDACIAPPSNIEVDGATTLCTGEDVTLTASPGYSYLWSNGSTDQSITVSTADTYTVEITDGSACVTTSAAINVIVDPEETFNIFAVDDIVICEGESVVIINESNEEVEWYDGSFGSNIEVSNSALVMASTEGTCGEIFSNTVNVEVLPIPAEPSNFTYNFNFDQVIMSVEGQGIQWYNDAQGINLIGLGNELTLNNVENSLKVYAASGSDEDGEFTNVGEVEHQGSSDFNSDGFNGAMLFNVDKEMLLNSVIVDTDLAGLRRIQLRDEFSTILEEKEFMVEAGTTELILNFTILPGDNYSLGTNSEQNFESFGYESPRFKRTSVDFGAILYFPYEVDNLMSITASNFGTNFFYYFYDWKVSDVSTTCYSELVEFNIEPNSVGNLIENGDFSLFPNPSDNIFNLQYTGDEQYDIRLLTMDGSEQLIANSIRKSYQLDLSDYASGIYIMEVSIGQDRYFSKVIKL